MVIKLPEKPGKSSTSGLKLCPELQPKEMCIEEIINIFLGAGRPSDGSVQMADLHLPQGHTYLTIPSNR